MIVDYLIAPLVAFAVVAVVGLLLLFFGWTLIKRLFGWFCLLLVITFSPRLPNESDEHITPKTPEG